MQNLVIDSLFIGQKIIYLPTCQSTNTYALELLVNESVLEGTTVITSQQTAGRGQRGNIWEVEPHQNLTFSVILMPNFLTASAQFYLNMAVALGIQQFLQTYLGVGVKVKWPNDILYNQQKICGVLIENVIRKTNLDKSVVGIGLNVNQLQFGNLPATSLKKIMGRDFHLEPLLAQLLKSLEEHYLLLRNEKYKQLKIKYLENLFRFEETHTYESNGETFLGRIITVEDSGRLILEVNGNPQSFDFKEVSFVY